MDDEKIASLKRFYDWDQATLEKKILEVKSAFGCNDDYAVELLLGARPLIRKWWRGDEIE